MTREDLLELSDDLVFAEGLDDAMLGVIQISGMSPMVVYERDVSIRILMSRDKLTEEQAENALDVVGEGAAFLERPDAY